MKKAIVLSLLAVMAVTTYSISAEANAPKPKPKPCITKPNVAGICG